MGIECQLMTNTLVCWRCGAPITDQALPIGRVAECSLCRASLHVCRMCELFDIRVAMSCREPIAEEVKDKERANFCEYFAVKTGAHSTLPGDKTQAARIQLEALFGEVWERREKTLVRLIHAQRLISPGSSLSSCSVQGKGAIYERHDTRHSGSFQSSRSSE